MAKFLNPIPAMDRNLLEDKRSSEEVINDFLSSKQGLSYLCMKYPNLSLENAIQSFKRTYYEQLIV